MIFFPCCLPRALLPAKLVRVLLLALTVLDIKQGETEKTKHTANPLSAWALQSSRYPAPRILAMLSVQEALTSLKNATRYALLLWHISSP